MEIKKNITIELSEEDVKVIIVNYLLSKGYDVCIDNVDLQVCSRLEGFGLTERPVNYFKGAYIHCKEK